eukprot:TRINITY_DN464_c0_g1_i1.p1 TRINITY_DN464_c0_g1~~TRINITY_DN464_c0_g1_i1.p1  ORF type:complete len:460 (+),score=122.68 TRINITY_DN464_c0_g1_i1:119-1498(+)
MSKVEWFKDDWWIVEDSVYDFKEFQHKHPGGRVWFQFNTHRDITISFHTYHKNTQKLRPILNKYRMGPKTDAYKPEIAIPAFLLPPDFDASKNIPSFDFETKDFLLPRVKEMISQPDVDRYLSWQNFLFDFVSVVLLIVYAFVSAGQCLGWVSPFVTIPLLVCLRTSLAGAGHYYVHATKQNWGSCLFDINYVGTSATAVDGHVMLHHTYTQSAADVKTSFFFSMLGLPTLWRIPGYTLHKLGNMLFGNFARTIEMNWFERDGSRIFPYSLFVMRIVLMVEFWVSFSYGTLGVWLVQYLLSLWFNTCLVLSSHEFEHYGTEHPGKDWGKFQVVNSYDMIIVGNPYIDLFLSAGLSPHRAHHLLPYQASGFANIASEPYIQKACKDMGIPWHKSKVFWTDRLPIILDFLFNSPTIVPNTGQVKRQRLPGWKSWVAEQFSVDGVSDFLAYITKGLVGIGAI